MERKLSMLNGHSGNVRAILHHEDRLYVWPNSWPTWDPNAFIVFGKDDADECGWDVLADAEFGDQLLDRAETRHFENLLARFDHSEHGRWNWLAVRTGDGSILIELGIEGGVGWQIVDRPDIQDKYATARTSTSVRTARTALGWGEW